jgi:hypothetical protein
MLSFMPTGTAPASHHQQSGAMFEDDLLGSRARSFPGLSHSLMPTPQPFPFAGFPMHHAPDPMASFSGEYSFNQALFFSILC